MSCAIDPDADALRELLAPHAASSNTRDFQVRVARLQDLNFKFAHFGAVHVSRVLHVLDSDGPAPDLRAKFFRWLYPEGKLYISTLAPAGAVLESVSGRLSQAPRSARSVAGLHRFASRIISRTGPTRRSRPSARWTGVAPGSSKPRASSSKTSTANGSPGIRTRRAARSLQAAASEIEFFLFVLNVVRRRRQGEWLSCRPLRLFRRARAP